MDQSDKTSPPAPLGPSLLKRFLQLIGIDNSPDTAEDLGHEIQELIEDGEEQGSYIVSGRDDAQLNH